MVEPIYEITFTVEKNPPTVSPLSPQAAGHFGDNYAARISFVLNGAADGRRYRIEVEDANGAYDITELLDAAGNVVSYTVPAAWTAAGVAKVRLVEVEVLDGIEKAIFHYPAAKLSFEMRDSGTSTIKMLPRWQSVMAASEAATERAKAAEYNADQAAAKALDEASKASTAKEDALDAAYQANTAKEAALAAAEVALQAKGPKGDKGDKGDTGPKGDKGDDNVLHVTVANGRASHTPSEIKEYVDSGGLVILGDGYFLESINSANAYFTKSSILGYDNAARLDSITINSDRSIDYYSQEKQFGQGGGSIVFDDDGNGNVTIGTSGGGEISFTDDGNGNVTLEVM